MTGFWLFFTDSGIFAYFCADAPCGFGVGCSPAMRVSLPLSMVPHAVKDSLMKDRKSSAFTHAPMPMPMGMHADASTSMPMPMPMPTMNVPVASASVPMRASVPVHAYAYAYAYCRGSAHILSAIGLHARPIAFTPKPMSAAVIISTTMIAPVPADDAAVDRFIIAGRSLPADAFHDASAHGSAPASTFMIMFMLMLAASATGIGCACVRTHDYGHGHARIHAHAHAYVHDHVHVYACGDCRIRTIALFRACFASPLPPAAPRGGATLLCGSHHSAAAPLDGASAFMNRFRTMGSVMLMRDDAGVMGGVREHEQCADGIIRR